MDSHLAMTTVEIAELTGKEHFHVMRDAKKLLDELELGQSKFGCSYLNSQNKKQPMFKLSKDLTLTLVSGYDAKMRYSFVTLSPLRGE